MKADIRNEDVVTVEESSNKGYALAVVFMVLTAASGYVLSDTYFNNNVIAKPEFLCTKIEQIGKNMDDVQCVQYTHVKYQKSAVAVNELINKELIASNKK